MGVCRTRALLFGSKLRPRNCWNATLQQQLPVSARLPGLLGQSGGVILTQWAPLLACWCFLLQKVATAPISKVDPMVSSSMGPELGVLIAPDSESSYRYKTILDQLQKQGLIGNPLHHEPGHQRSPCFVKGLWLDPGPTTRVFDPIDRPKLSQSLIRAP